MIRIPFSDESRGPIEPAVSNYPRNEGRGEARHGRLEDRMRMLESKLSIHAGEICENVTARVERIESRIQRAIESMTGEGDESPSEKVVEFSGSSSLHHLPAISAKEALNELNETLELTREHLTALKESVSRMQGALK